MHCKIAALLIASLLLSLSGCKKWRDVDYLVIDLSAGPSAESYPVSHLEDVPEGGWPDEYKTTKLVLRRIPAGEFMMGSPTNEVLRSQYETYHHVKLTTDFYLGVFEVTQRQYELVTGRNPSDKKGPANPVESVSYSILRGRDLGSRWPASAAVDPDTFIGRLRTRTGLSGLDLPTEAQWEFACRAGTETPFSNGAILASSSDIYPKVEAIATICRYKFNPESGDRSVAVGSFEPNSFGLYDMHGNVWEWCLDWWAKSPEESVDPVGPAAGQYRVRRGGSFYDTPRVCRSSWRNPCYYYDAPSWSNNTTGFRLCLSVRDDK